MCVCVCVCVCLHVSVWGECLSSAVHVFFGWRSLTLSVINLSSSTDFGDLTLKILFKVTGEFENEERMFGFLF